MAKEYWNVFAVATGHYRHFEISVVGLGFCVVIITACVTCKVGSFVVFKQRFSSHFFVLTTRAIPARKLPECSHVGIINSTVCDNLIMKKRTRQIPS